jgi:hypothetical protein
MEVQEGWGRLTETYSMDEMKSAIFKAASMSGPSAAR